MPTNLAALIQSVRDEAAVLEKYLGETKALSESIRRRDWSGLQDVLLRIEGISLLAEVTEQNRAALWDEILAESGLPADASVYRLALGVTEPERGLLTDAYRRLKVAALRTRIENEALGEFVGETSSTIRSLVEELFPDQKGRIYGRSGHAVATGARPIVLDTAL
ncbi:MAG TPA: flagellar export chaperone FlgN [Magnetospirillaceae bacterium]|nr:flagellar export chaperone FlgN [Magnetospirillaceae bacterium]